MRDIEYHAARDDAGGRLHIRDRCRIQTRMTTAQRSAVLLTMLLAVTAQAAVLQPTNLRCEYRVNPLGVAAQKPRLSWVLVSDKPAERGQKQSAYEILVASSREQLDADKGDLWNLGKTRGDATAQIEYVGAPLASGQQ